MDKIKIKKNSVQETLIIPLYSRKMCAEQFPTLYRDKYAEEICNKIDYDFSDLNKNENRLMYQFGSLEGAMRELDMIYEIKDYLKTHEKAAVVNMGCGLNMTGRNADNGSCKMYNLDFQDVIELRNQIIPTCDREENIACDLNDFEWMNKIDSTDGAVFYAAGVFHYFTKEQIKKMVIAMAENFPGCILVFDTAGKFARDKLMKFKLKKFGINDVSGLFCISKENELKGWSDKIVLSSRKSYMNGYYALDDPNIRPMHKFLAKLCDSLAKMYINRFEFVER